ncbi:MAG: DUF1512 family protein [Candidatus Njordarchaeota archaeon]
MFQIGLDYILSLIVFMLFIFFSNELQMYMIILSLNSFIDEIKIYEKLSNRMFAKLIFAHRQDLIEKYYEIGTKKAARAIMESGEFKKIMEWIDEVVNSFLIDPVTLDPTEVLDRLEHIIDIRRRRMLFLAERILPSAPNFVIKNLESAMEAAAAIRYTRKISEHIFRIGKNTKNIYYLLQLKLFVPFLRELCLSFFDALKGFIEGAPIGDTVGALVAQKFFGDEVEEDSDLRVVFSSTEIDGRYVLAIKAKGPGSEVGQPGKFLEKIIQKIEGNVDAIITVDAALRLESEKVGKVDVGVGAAIGDPGPEKFRIEKWATKYRIPLYAVVIKENYIESLTPLRKSLLNAVNKAYETVKRIILEEVPEGGKVIILGIGNTVGAGNSPIGI